MSTIRAAFFIKNLPVWERALRIGASLVLVLFALLFLSAPRSWVVAASAAGFGLTGIVGFCPMCALAGRRLAQKS